MIFSLTLPAASLRTIALRALGARCLRHTAAAAREERLQLPLLQRVIRSNSVLRITRCVFH